MPVRKHRSVEEMKSSTWRDSNDPGLSQAIKRVWEFARRTTCPQFPPGVYKHRSVEEAEQLRERWEQASFDAFHRRRLEGRETDS